MQAYAIIQTGGQQFTVKPGDEIKVERIPGKAEGEEVELPVLAAHDGNEFKVGTPLLEEKVKATVVREFRDKKVIVFKKHRRQTYRKKNGHRQNVFSLRIDAIPGN
ncbi:MAG: 50S ribosomal protein L21 [Acidobacteria bacterium]|nr:MAG: 50S ribosomal protein L21 [Acidobacteriota bacterium]